MTVDLRPIWAKLDRANKHLGEVGDLLADFDKLQPHTQRCEPNADRSQHDLICVLDDPDVVLRWSCAIGDCLHNLRAALDYTLAAAIRAEGTEPVETVFPIYTSESRFNALNPRDDSPAAWSGLRKIQQVTNTAVREAIIDAQPYSRVQQTHLREHHALVILDKLESADKHGTLHPVFMARKKSADERTKLRVFPQQERPFIEYAEVFEHNAPIMRIFTVPGSHVLDVEFNFTLQVSLEIPGGPAGLTWVLALLTKETLDTVDRHRLSNQPRGSSEHHCRRHA